MSISSPKLNKYNTSSNLEDENDIETLYDAFKMAWKSQAERMKNFQLNERILKCFDNDLLGYFEEKFKKENGGNDVKKMEHNHNFVKN